MTTFIENISGTARPKSQPTNSTELAVLFGVPIDNVSMDQTIATIADSVEMGRFFGSTHQITTVNVDFLVNAVTNADVLDILQHSDLNLPDGMPVVWGSSWLGTPLTARVTGADLIPRLVAESATNGWRVHFFGGTPEVNDAAAAWAAEHHPDAQVSWEAGPMIDESGAVDDDTIEAIRQVNADIVCVSLGNPKQERFIARYVDRIGAPVMIGIGGSLDLLTGEKKRAPIWVQNTGLEWIFRAVQEPRRLGARYLRDVRVFTPRIAAYVTRTRKHRRGASHRVKKIDDRLVLTFGYFSGFDDPTPWRPDPGQTMPHALHIDFSNVTSLGPGAHSTLLAMVRFARRRKVQISCVNVNTDLEDCLATYGTLGMLDDLVLQRTPEVPGPTAASTPVFTTVRPSIRVGTR